MEESNIPKGERKYRKRQSNYFSTESPDRVFASLQRTKTPEAINDDAEESPKKDKPADPDEEEDIEIDLGGMDIDGLALDGAMAMNVLNDVLQKIGIDVSGNEPQVKHSKKQMSPWEIKCNIQTQIILHLGKRMEKMQKVVDDLNSKLTATITQKQRIKIDRDETRSRLLQVTADLKEKTSHLNETLKKGVGQFDEQEIINTVLNDLRNTSNILEETSKTAGEDFFDLNREPDPNSVQAGDDEEPLEELLAAHSDTKDQLRKMIAIMQIQRKHDPPTKLGVGLKSTITDDDIMSLNPFRGNIRTPYKLDAFNYQPKEAQRLIRQAKNQVEFLYVSTSTRQQQLLKAKDKDEVISIMEDQSSQTMNSLSVCLELLCEEQIYAWKWRSRCKQLGRQLEEIRNLFSRANIEANRMVRKEQRMVGSILYKEYIRSGTLKTPQAPNTPSSPGNINRSLTPLIRSQNNRSNIGKNSPNSILSDIRSRPHTGITHQSIDSSTSTSIMSFPELEVSYIDSLDY